MDLVFIYGEVATGKLTVARALAAQTGLSLFHNHLIVDAVEAVFPFGSPQFVALRERFWIETIVAAARADQSLIFTFAPESTVAADFPARLAALVAAAGGRVRFIALTVSDAEQERRLVAASRADFGKLRSIDLLRSLKADFAASLAQMPPAALTIDTEAMTPDAAAAQIARHLAS